MVKDTRRLSPAAAALYAGTKLTVLTDDERPFVLYADAHAPGASHPTSPDPDTAEP